MFRAQQCLVLSHHILLLLLFTTTIIHMIQVSEETIILLGKSSESVQCAVCYTEGLWRVRRLAKIWLRFMIYDNFHVPVNFSQFGKMQQNGNQAVASSWFSKEFDYFSQKFASKIWNSYIPNQCQPQQKEAWPHLKVAS